VASIKQFAESFDYEAHLRKRAQEKAKRFASSAQQAQPAETWCLPVIEKPKREKQIIRQSKKELNKTERRFELAYLMSWKATGEIDRYGGHESIRLELANGARFSPDFPTWRDGRLTFFEVKGAKIWDDAKDRIKIAAREYPEFTFYLCQWKAGEWIIQKVLP